MASVYTIRIAGQLVPLATITDLGLVPAGRRWICRDLVVHNNGAQMSPLSIWIVTPGGSPTLYKRELDPDEFEHIELRQVVEEGELIQCYATSSVFSVLLTGYDFSTTE